VSDPTPAVGVVSVAFNSSPVIGAFLSSLPSEGIDGTLIVDNTDGRDVALQEVVAQYPGTAIIRSPNVGYGAAMNRGVGELPPHLDWILLSNPDVILRPGAIESLLRAGQEYPASAAFGPLIRTSEGGVYPSARKLPSLRNGIGHALFTRTWPSNPWSASYREELDSYSQGRQAAWLSGSCVLVRRSAFEAIGGFDESFFMYFEDVDLGDRLARAGWTSRFVPEAEIMHSGAHSTAQSSGAMMIAHHRSAYRYLAKKYGAWYLWPLRLILRVALGVRGRLAAWRA
jgi:N-acetylglucosaminyl-diphospho-decaprenol L-rhamnosyltransferase